MNYYNPLIHLTFTAVPDWLQRRRELRQGAKSCYSRLARWYNEHEGYAYPSVDAIAYELGVSDRQVRTYLRSLEQVGLIERRRRGPGSTNAYVFPDHPWRSETADPPADRKFSSGRLTPVLTGSELPETAEENFRSDRKKTSPKETTRRNNLRNNMQQQPRESDRLRAAWITETGRAPTPGQLKRLGEMDTAAAERGDATTVPAMIAHTARIADGRFGFLEKLFDDYQAGRDWRKPAQHASQQRGRSSAPAAVSKRATIEELRERYGSWCTVAEVG